MKVLELVDVKKIYKLENKETFTALENVNVSFDKGELVSIIGESGSGKSTLMNLIGGLDSDYLGTINVDGKDLKKFKEKDLDDYRKKKIGFVFQSFNLIPHLSVVDNVTIGLTLSNEKESVKHKKAVELLTKLGLKDQIKKKPTQLSGGQKQRVAIARALINDPDIILADEPTGALDSTTTAQILEILKEIADEGKLVIMVTHSEKVAKISSRVVEISDGKIIRDEKNLNYKPNEIKKELTENEEENKDIIETKKKKEGHLSLWSAMKLSFHNMWAKKTKNILMAIGVSICLISLILMLSFGSGLTGYLSDTAEQYTNPTIATLSKSGKNRDGSEVENSDMMDMLIPKTFSEEEIIEIRDELNMHLEKQGNDFRVIYDTVDTSQNNLSYGYSMMTMTAGKVTYTPPTPEGEEEKEPISGSIIYTYTTPPYYTKDHLLTKCEESHTPNPGEPEIMLSRAAAKKFGFTDIEKMVGVEVLLDINFGVYSIQKPVKISAIVDVSLFASMMVMYIDYDYLNECVVEAQTAANEKDPNVQITGLVPSLLFIQTDSENTTNIINSYIQENRKDLSGSLEEQVVSLFTELMDTFSIALAVISGISLAVALIMILVVLYMSVSERTKEIGVLKSIGARKKDIKLIFSSESFLIGLLSGIMGIILTLVIGGILTLVFNSLIGFAPIKMMWYYFLEALAISIGISVIAGLYPASKAAKLDPVDSLRHE